MLRTELLGCSMIVAKHATKSLVTLDVAICLTDFAARLVGRLILLKYHGCACE